MSVPQPVELDPRKTALLCIDLQRGILEKNWQPRPSEEVLQNCLSLIQFFHEGEAQVVFVHVGWKQDLSDAPPGTVDVRSHPPEGYPPGWSDLDERLPQQEQDLTILKHQWGAFEGTDLERLLRKRGIDTLVVCGIATNLGVESTARQAFEKHFHVILVEEAMSSFSPQAHDFAVRTIFPRIGRVCCAKELQWTSLS